MAADPARSVAPAHLLDARQSRADAADPRSRGGQRKQLPGHAPRVRGRHSPVRRHAPVRADTDEDRRVPRRRDSRESPSPAVRRVEVRREKPRATGLRRSAGRPLDDPPALALQDRAAAVRSRRRRERHREPFAGEPGAVALIAGIVLAAGFARRMGRQKLLLAVRGAPIVRLSVEALRPHVEDLVVVTGRDDTGVREALAGIDTRFATTPRPQDGQGSSIAIGVAALMPWTSAALVALGDQPRVPSTVVPALLDAWRRTGKPIVAPVYHGTQGTPVLFSADVFAELCALSGDSGAKSIVQARRERVELVTIDAPMPADVDTPEDYARLHVE